MIFLIIMAASIVIFLTIFLPILISNKKYDKFLFDHSVGLNKLILINSKYHFRNVDDYNLSHSYDNENFYRTISCRDYLIYQLQFIQKGVLRSISNTKFNFDLYEKYVSEIKSSCVLYRYDSDRIPRNIRKLKRREQRLFRNAMCSPVIVFVINVLLILTRINGSYRTCKKATFDEQEIEKLIKSLNRRKGDFYYDDSIWQSICRVERGKVTNKLRFAIYSRDNYRCRKCGRRTNDLEVDHIIPISKGGKSTYDNLQTLCHRCNMKKGSKIENWYY